MSNDFDTRKKSLNEAQKLAVETIDGPLLVIAGPGTGKTELLSMRAANILRKTDASPENILCLTFTDSGSAAMRARLTSIIGPEAYKVSIHTFHSFCTEIINQNHEYFYNGASLDVADDISKNLIIEEILDELDYRDALASKFNGKYSAKKDILNSIRDLKNAGLTAAELLQIIDANEKFIDEVEPKLTEIFSISLRAKAPLLEKMVTSLYAVAEEINSLSAEELSLPPSIEPLSAPFLVSLKNALDKNNIKAWRDKWLKKNKNGDYVFVEDRKRNKKLRTLAFIYEQYMLRMNEAELFDFDDMILNVIQAMDKYPELVSNLQERYQYIMVDEFQDTNPAQMRILFKLTETTTGDDPNVMAVGDDDQAIYSFQGADINNIMHFRQYYPNFKHIILTENYRSGDKILESSREVSTNISNRLETSMDICKKLTARTQKYADADVKIVDLPNIQTEYHWIANSIAEQISKGTNPNEIAVLARKHDSLKSLVPYLLHNNISVNYDFRDNVLTLNSIQAIELIARIISEISNENHDLANSMIPELLCHPMFNIPAETIWRLSLKANRERLSWLEIMLENDSLRPIASWIIECAKDSKHKSLEDMIDEMIGNPSVIDSAEQYRSPYYDYYFNKNNLEENPIAYIEALEALRAIRSKLREYKPNSFLCLDDFINFIDQCDKFEISINSTIQIGNSSKNAVNLMTAHKSKGLEFETVYIINSTDKKWFSGRSETINYPANLAIREKANTEDDIARLYFVAMTRAKQNLIMTYSRTDDSGKETAPVRFITGLNTPTLSPLLETDDLEEITKQAEINWYDNVIQNPTTTMKELLAPVLEKYKLSVTHLNNFIDLQYNGPDSFFMNNLLKFPKAKNMSSIYGSAIHKALENAHHYIVKTNKRKSKDDIINDFKHVLHSQRISEQDYEKYSKRGEESLSVFLNQYYDTFNTKQKAELDFSNQGVVVNDAILTGKMDLIEINDNNIFITDYKTGKIKDNPDKIKLHKYKQQLMFYQILAQESRDYSKYNFAGAKLQWVDPDKNNEIKDYENEKFSDEEINEFKKLINAVWNCIKNLDFPDTSSYSKDLNGIKEFEKFLIENKSNL